MSDQNTKAWNALGVLILFFFLGILVGNQIRIWMWKPILIEHGAAYYDARTGEFVIIRKDGEGQ